MDKYLGPKTDILMDLSQPFTELPASCVSHVYSRHTLEHLPDILPLFSELHRICRPDAVIDIIVPHFSNVYGYSDPTHVRLFGIYSMYYFSPQSLQPKRKVPEHYLAEKFRITAIRLEFHRSGFIDWMLARLMKRWVNRSFARQEFYERGLARIFRAWQVRYLMSPLKT